MAAGSVGWRDQPGPGLALWVEREVLGEWMLLTITWLGRTQLKGTLTLTVWLGGPVGGSAQDSEHLAVLTPCPVNRDPRGPLQVCPPPALLVLSRGLSSHERWR